MPDLLERLTAALGDRYAIEREVGRGGMAVVFLAEDLKHHRRVALKVLHPELTATLGAERFLHEIEIIAGLQHPHILPLYDSGEVEGLLYYVMPYAEGESLRQRLDREKQLAVDESVRITVEVADGLDYAHRRGVVHRDIKPGNILLAEGHATIADFGIARAIEAARADRVTSTGLGVGTPLYASPEQATAQETLDGRTDIYSLGCVLYEMLAGQPPLTGATPQIIQARRVSETPSPLHSLRDTVPPALDHLIARALARIPADRYATASQFGQALHAVLLTATPAAHLGLTPPTAKPAHRSRAFWRIGLPIALGGAVIVVAGVWLAADWLGGRPLQITVSSSTHVTTDPGLEFQPAISPDGDEVAYVEGPIENPRIVVRSARELGRGESRPGAEVSGLHWFPGWTPDGVSLRFRSCERRVLVDCDWKEVGSRGGAVRSVSVPAGSERHAWSRDGTRVAYVTGDSIFAYSTDDGETTLLGVQVVFPDPHSLVWSPDERWIAYVNGNSFWRTGANVSTAAIWILDARGGEPIPVTDEEHMNVSPQWLPDSRHLLFVSDRDGSRGIYVAEIGPDGPKGSARSVLPSSDSHSISISADGRRLAHSKFTAVQNIWSIPIPESGFVSITDAVPVTEGNQVVELHDLSSDGRWIAFDSDIRGEFDIYRQSLTGGAQEMVADIAGRAFDPDWSPDGTEIALYAWESEGAGGTTAILVVPAGGGTPERVTRSPGLHTAPDWSPDGLAIAFSSYGSSGSEPRNVWIVTRDGPGLPWADPVQLTDFGCGHSRWAPDGESLVCWAGKGRLARVSRAGDVLMRYDPSAVGLHRYTNFKFSPDGSRVYVIATEEDGSRGVWWMPARGGDATKVVAFDDP